MKLVDGWEGQLGISDLDRAEGEEGFILVLSIVILVSALKNGLKLAMKTLFCDLETSWGTYKMCSDYPKFPYT